MVVFYNFPQNGLLLSQLENFFLKTFSQYSPPDIAQVARQSATKYPPGMHVCIVSSDKKLRYTNR